jgi:hypothetical protein
VTPATLVNHMSVRAVLAAGLVYVVAWAAIVVFACREFGAGGVVTLSWLLLLPFLIGIRLRRHWPDVRKRDLAGLAASVLLLPIAGGGLVIWQSYDLGIPEAHARDLRFAELGRCIGQDPAFRDVEAKQIPFKALCPIYDIEGTVTSKADLDRLKTLVEQYGFDLGNVKVREESVGLKD